MYFFFSCYLTYEAEDGFSLLATKVSCTCFLFCELEDSFSLLATKISLTYYLTYELELTSTFWLPKYRLLLLLLDLRIKTTFNFLATKTSFTC